MINEGPLTYCGYVALVGRPNVGKSTLLNRLVGSKLSITSRKPQTTRHRLLGVKTEGSVQILYVDTPGMHINETRALNREMNKEANRALMDVDVVVFVVDGLKWTLEDQLVFEKVMQLHRPVILAINKIDMHAEKSILLPHIESLASKFTYYAIIPISAKNGTNIEVLEKNIKNCLPQSPHYFPETALTDRTPRFRIAEIIREKIIRILGAELPYTTTVEIDAYDKDKKIPEISAIIWVEREGQKPIVIGKNGEKLKNIGIQSRQDIEKILEKKIHLKLWVKVREGWSNDERALKSLGYMDFE